MATIVLPRARAEHRRSWSRWSTGAAALGCVLLVALPRLPGPVGVRATVVGVAFVSLVVESLPFLLAGAAIAALLHGGVGHRLVARAARSPRLAPMLAPFTGSVLPLCDCGLVPLARELRAAGCSGATVNGFVAGSPLTNPIVVVSTLLAFPGNVAMVAGRVVVGVAVAMLAASLAPVPATGSARAVAGTTEPPSEAASARQPHRDGFLDRIAAEVTLTGPTLILGALAAGVVKGLVPVGALSTLAAQPLLGAGAMMLLAFLMSICSQADAFVAASLPVGNLPRLCFMVLGPMLDLRLSALYRREFGNRWLAGYAAVVVPSVLVLATAWMTWGPR